MAHLSRRRAERRLRSALRPLLALALTGAGVVLPAGGQEAPEPEPYRVGAFLELGGALTGLHGDLAPVFRGAALVALTPGLSVGGGGSLLASDRPVEGDLVFPNRVLGFGYGGLVVESRLASVAGPHRVSLGGLIGVGNVDLRDRGTGARLASDNVVVVEPAVVYRRLWGPRFATGVSLSWRGVLGLEDVDGVESGDLTGLALAVTLRVGPL